MLRLAQQLLERRPALAIHMDIVSAELQFDRKKLIVYAQMKKWVRLRVSPCATHATVDFVQRPGQGSSLEAGVFN